MFKVWKGSQAESSASSCIKLGKSDTRGQASADIGSQPLVASLPSAKLDKPLSPVGSLETQGFSPIYQMRVVGGFIIGAWLI